jgi:hypothetical protein
VQANRKGEGKPWGVARDEVSGDLRREQQVTERQGQGNAGAARESELSPRAVPRQTVDTDPGMCVRVKLAFPERADQSAREIGGVHAVLEGSVGEVGVGETSHKAHPERTPGVEVGCHATGEAAAGVALER